MTSRILPERTEIEPESEAQTKEWAILEHLHACGLAAKNQRDARSAPEFWDCEPV